MLGRTTGNHNSRADKSSGVKEQALTTRCTGTTFCTPPLMDTPGWPTANC